MKQVASDIDESYEGLEELIENMFETMHEAPGVGLAAPQIGKSIRLFVVDATSFGEVDEEEDEEDTPEKEFLRSFKKVFINPKMIEEMDEEWPFSEGCLSIPNITDEVYRRKKLRIRYRDEHFKEHEEEFEGIAARIIQHEYDHLEGILFVDKLNPLKRRLLKRKLIDISKGDTEVSYKMKFPLKKR